VGELVGEQVGEWGSAWGMIGGIAKSNQREIELGKVGMLGDPNKPHGGGHEGGGHEDEHVDPKELESIGTEMQSDAQKSIEHVDTEKSKTEDGSKGIGSLEQDAKPLTDVVKQTDKAKATIEQSENALESSQLDKSDSEETQRKKTEKVTEVEKQLDVETSSQKSDSSKEDDEESIDEGQLKSSDTGETEKPVQKQPVQMKKDPSTKPSMWQRFKRWIGGKASGLKKRAAAAFAKMKAKLAQMVIQMLGLKKFKAELDAALVEQRDDAASSLASLADARAAAQAYKKAAEQLQSSGSGSGSKQSKGGK
jgi:hypothetical protein